jgi:hypothetical protein
MSCWAWSNTAHRLHLFVTFPGNGDRFRHFGRRAHRFRQCSFHLCEGECASSFRLDADLFSTLMFAESFARPNSPLIFARSILGVIHANKTYRLGRSNPQGACRTRESGWLKGYSSVDSGEVPPGHRAHESRSVRSSLVGGTSTAEGAGQLIASRIADCEAMRQARAELPELQLVQLVMFHPRRKPSRKGMCVSVCEKPIFVLGLYDCRSGRQSAYSVIQANELQTTQNRAKMISPFSRKLD